MHESTPSPLVSPCLTPGPAEQSLVALADVEPKATACKRKAPCPTELLQPRKRSRAAATSPIDWVAVFAEQQQQKVEVLINGFSLGWLVAILPTPDAAGCDCTVEWSGWPGCVVPAKLARLSRRN